MKSKFKIHCIAVCKNEADVIGACLKHAATWADYIYVYDGASTDGTWDVVLKLSQSYPNIIPWRQDSKVFKEGLRAEVFNAFRHEARAGDWWFQLNVDEFYDENPRDFLAAVAPCEHLAWGIMAEYVLTEKDIETLDFSRPFEEIKPLLRYYYVAWSEPRAFRYRPGLVWSDQNAWPNHVGLAARRRITYKHYPCRSPRQIQTRLLVREQNRKKGFEGWPQKVEDWRSGIKKSAEFAFDDGKSQLIIDEKVLPRHLEPLHLRLAKRILHATGIWP